jgi:VIT1/CCC1 family predicted Fe2+/Mn2+ transporter
MEDTRPIRHEKHHRSERIEWLRAAVMGANDGTVV